MTLQEKLYMLRMQQVPIPLIGMQAVTQAMNLRRAGMTYGAITIAMRVYHGSAWSEHYWRHKLREHGAPPKHHPNGVLRVPPQDRAR